MLRGLLNRATREASRGRGRPAGAGGSRPVAGGGASSRGSVERGGRQLLRGFLKRR